MNKIKYTLLIVIVIGGVLLSASDFRHYLLSGVIKVPSIVSTMRYQSYLEKRNFKKVVDVLNDEYNFVKYFSSQTNRLLLHFIENLRDTYRLTELSSEKNYYRLLVEDVINNYPGILPTYEIESDLLINKGERVDDLINKLELFDIFYRPIYMDGIISDATNNKKESKWCASYLEESVTDISVPYHRPMISRQDGNIAAIISYNDKEKIAWSSKGEVGNSIVRLNYDNLISTDRIALVLTTQVGSKVTIKKVSLLKNGVRNYLNNFIIYSKEATFITDRILIALDINTKINFVLDSEKLFDAIELEFTTDPMNPLSYDICNIQS